MAVHEVRVGGVPVVLVTGVEAAAAGLVATVLQVDLPRAVTLAHRIDVERGVLVRVVSDLGGVVEREEVPLAHVCTTCALREDVLPTLERLARSGRWDAVVAQLPVAAPATAVCRAAATDPRLARHLHVVAVVAAVDGAAAEEDLLGDDLLVERGRHSGDDDRRGVGEVACALVEQADVVVLTGAQPDPATDLVRALARPGAGLVRGAEALDGVRLLRARHDLRRTEAWNGWVRRTATPAPAPGRAWVVELRSEQPFHPGRLLAGIEALGAGRHRGRGCCWLPTRPGDVLAWDGAGGQLSIGDAGPWAGRTPRTHLVLTGTGRQPAHLHDAFAHLLVRPGERVALRTEDGPEDGFEPWLGPRRDAA